jgi:hypothetical protein
VADRSISHLHTLFQVTAERLISAFARLKLKLNVIANSFVFNK